MKALSIQRPWIDAILAGEKTIEVRKWETKYRGPFLLHASKAWGRKQKELFAFVEERYGVNLPPPSHAGENGIMGIATLSLIRPVGIESARAALAESSDFGLYGWKLTDVRPLDFIPCTGALQLFKVPPEVEAQVLAQLGHSYPDLEL